jgi:hypothetical protein
MRGGENNCIFVPFQEGMGLGNHMFIYGVALAIKEKMGLPLCLLPVKSSHNNAANYRDFLFKQGTAVEFAAVKDRMDSAKAILNNKSNGLHRNSSNEILPSESGNDYVISQKEPAVYQNYNSIKSVIPIIRTDCAKAFEEKYPGFKDTISNKSAFMHVRRGDYVKEKYNNVEDAYYKHGVDILSKDAKIDTIYILSDEINWCKEQGWDSSKIKWFDGEDSKDELKAMYLMSLCLGGACISASTFALWGVILGADQNTSATIIYPVKWVTGAKSSELKFPSWWKALSNSGIPAVLEAS